MYVVRKRYQCMRDATIALQALLRGYLVRNKYQMVRNNVLLLYSNFISTYLQNEAALWCPLGNLHAVMHDAQANGWRGSTWKLESSDTVINELLISEVFTLSSSMNAWTFHAVSEASNKGLQT